MHIVPLESRQLTQAENQIREGVIKAYRLLEGVPGPANFALKLVNIAGKFHSPRHRHNFDQIRFQIEGEFDYAADGHFEPGSVGYFPEGTRYGPQTSDGDTWNLLLQFGGASGSGYTSESEEDRAAAALKQHGSFDKGVYTYLKPDGTKVNQDAYEALWEHIHGRPLVYPKPRYDKPVFMKSQHFDWLPVAGQPGVTNKVLGVFSERETTIRMWRVDAAATLALQADSFYFLMSGSGNVSSQACSRHTTIRTEAGEQGTFTAEAETTLLQLQVPVLSMGHDRSQ